MRHVMPCVVVVLVILAAPAAAQDDRRVGLLFAYPNAIGVQWDVSDRFGVRVDGTYDWHQSTVIFDYSRVLPAPGSPIPPRESESTHHLASIGVSPLIVIGAPNALKVYLAPRLGVGIHHGPGGSISLTPVVTGTIIVVVDGDVVQTQPGTSPTERVPSQTEYSLDAGVAAGAAYRFSDRFAFFGEAGFTYDRTTGSARTEARHSIMGLRAGIGGILYF